MRDLMLEGKLAYYHLITKLGDGDEAPIMHLTRKDPDGLVIHSLTDLAKGYTRADWVGAILDAEIDESDIAPMMVCGTSDLTGNIITEVEGEIQAMFAARSAMATIAVDGNGPMLLYDRSGDDKVPPAFRAAGTIYAQLTPPPGKEWTLASIISRGMSLRQCDEVEEEVEEGVEETKE